MDDCVPGNNYLTPGQCITKYLMDLVWVVCSIVRSWVWDTDMPWVLVADEMGLGKRFTSVAAAVTSKLPTLKAVMGLPLSILWGNTLDPWVNSAENDYPGIIGEEWKWYPLQRLNSGVRHLVEIQTTPAERHPALTLALALILVVTMPGVAEMFKSVIN